MTSSVSASTASSNRGRPGSARSAVWKMMRLACDVAAAVHCVFLALFASLGLPLLVWVNVGSIGIFVASRALLARRKNMWAVVLIAGEVVIHAAAASLLLGWDSGFHYYLLTLVGPLVITMSGGPGSKVARLAAFGLCYALLDARTRQVLPLYRLDRHLVDVLRYLNFAGMLAVMAFVSLTYYQLVAAAEVALRALASTDPLTGLHNRRRLLEIVRESRALGPSRPMAAVLLCDIDHFKQINDRHGHNMGDHVLQRVAGALTASLRGGASVARWGGEEFVVLVPGADADAAVQAGERIRRAVADLSVEWPANDSFVAQPPPPDGSAAPPLRVTITIGVACIDPAESIDTAIARADAALYRGKAAGRNRVVVAADSAISIGQAMAA